LRIRVGNRPNRRPHDVGEARQNVGIDAIGLRQLPRRFRKGAHLPRIYDDHRQLRGNKRGHAQQLIPAGRFKDDQLQRHRSQPFDERTHPAFVVHDSKPLAGGEYTHNQLRFCDINPDKHWIPPREVASPVLVVIRARFDRPPQLFGLLRQKT
jgi:hypothetical protein